MSARAQLAVGAVLQREARPSVALPCYPRSLPTDFPGNQGQAAPQPGRARARAQEWRRAVPHGTADLSSGGLCLQAIPDPAWDPFEPPNQLGVHGNAPPKPAEGVTLRKHAAAHWPTTRAQRCLGLGTASGQVGLTFGVPAGVGGGGLTEGFPEGSSQHDEM